MGGGTSWTGSWEFPVLPGGWLRRLVTFPASKGLFRPGGSAGYPAAREEVDGMARWRDPGLAGCLTVTTLERWTATSGGFSGSSPPVMEDTVDPSKAESLLFSRWLSFCLAMVVVVDDDVMDGPTADGTLCSSDVEMECSDSPFPVNRKRSQIQKCYPPEPRVPQGSLRGTQLTEISDNTKR